MAIDQTQFYTEMTTGQETGDLDPDFLTAVNKLPPWGETDAVKSAYETFFDNWGTHVIKRCHYGSNVTAEFGANFGTSIDGKKGDSFEEYQKQHMTTASVIGGDHESSLKLQREPDSKDRYAEWAKSNNKVINSAVTGLTVHTLPKLIHDCGVAKWKHMDHALKHFTQSVSPQEITVYGYLYTSEIKRGNYIDVQMWGAVSDFNMGSIDGGETKEPKHLVKSYVCE
ncbi:hypothetical protein N7501_007275 [Penicillium viridicatum]|nr:hypothetical protein N7501_007275 [Penicillium viridicatum]